MYKASDVHGRVQKALEEVFKKYGKASHEERASMVTKIILESHMYVLIWICSLDVWFGNDLSRSTTE